MQAKDFDEFIEEDSRGLGGSATVPLGGGQSDGRVINNIEQTFHLDGFL